MEDDFKHIQSAHCETGVTTNLLRGIGMEQMTEPLAFGIGSGLFFTYIPLLKINNGPAIAFRTLPGNIFSKTCHSLGVHIVRKKFSSKEDAQKQLDNYLEEGHRVGCQVGVYYLPYFPKQYRFHFNAHNIIVYGKEGDTYLVSDPIMETVTSLTGYELERVRFARGMLAPKGQLYYPVKDHFVKEDKIKEAIKKGIKGNVFSMLTLPGFISGIHGIKYIANRIKKWRDKLGLEKAGLYLAQLVRMQEEIGTGGGGFRYIYAAFLQEANVYHNNDLLLQASENFTQAGDMWRTSAVQAAGIYKGRIGTQTDFNVMGDYLLEIAEVEKRAFETLSKIKWQS